jgi:hypothetical protein
MDRGIANPAATAKTFRETNRDNVFARAGNNVAMFS